MPLLICAGLTPTNRSFLGCAIFMSGETEDDYAWATSSISTPLGDFGSPQVIVTDNEAPLLKATKHTFPAAHSILCRWHINRNIVKHCKKNFANTDEWESLMSAWSGLCTSPTQEQFELSWLQLQRDFEQYPSTVKYIESTWLSHKEKFVDAWIGKVLHLGCVTTSRAESSNSFLKKFLSSSIGDLLAVFQETHLAIQHQVHELKKDIADNKFKRPGFTYSLSYENVVHKVSNYALTEVNRHKTNSTSVSCSTSFTSTTGLPCVHAVRVRENNNEPLRLSDFHHHWHLDRVSFQPSRSTDLPAQTLDVLIPEIQQTFQTAPPHRQLEIIETIKDAVQYGYGNRLQDPQVARTKGRPNGARNKSTKQDPSGFEYAEKIRKCSKRK